MTPLPFIKMHGLGNDFVVLDFRGRGNPLDASGARAIADRRTGVGCDQVLAIEPAATELADVFLRIYNPDGGEAEACGNGTRCVASLLMAETGAEHVVIETVAGMRDAEARPDDLVAVDMGPARDGWRDIPLTEAVDTLHLPISAGPLADGVAVNMGNPHAVFFVDDAATVDLARLGPVLERDPLFPERANIGVVQVLSRDRLRFRVWERGAGITRACGSGACAALVAAHRRGLSERRVEVVLDGGILTIEWLADGHVMMTGPVATSFAGTLDPALLTNGIKS